MDRDVGLLNEGVQMAIPSELLENSANTGSIFRLRTYFDAATGSRTEMGVTVFLLKNGDESELDPDNVVAKASSLDSEHGNLLNMVAIDV